ncbi:hypothetical protein LCGC14_0288700 [marine sediment metagenome]|uniref:Uncharacterized protein n=1 Tax=marine sediment metagenome TaxID=412755 RepID=A0A0F9WZB6_9ZZZZ
MDDDGQLTLTLGVFMWILGFGTGFLVWGAP